MLPCPTSTQTIVSIGYKVGGRLLALFTLMTLASFLYTLLEQRGLSSSVLRFIGPMAVGFIIYAAVRIGRKVVVDKTTATTATGTLYSEGDRWWCRLCRANSLTCVTI